MSNSLPLVNVGEVLDKVIGRNPIVIPIGNPIQTVNTVTPKVYPNKVTEWMKVIVYLLKSKCPKHYSDISVYCGKDVSESSGPCCNLVKQGILTRTDVGMYSLTSDWMDLVGFHFSSNKVNTLLGFCNDSGVETPPIKVYSSGVVTRKPIPFLESMLSTMLEMNRDTMRRMEKRQKLLESELSFCDEELETLRRNVETLQLVVK